LTVLSQWGIESKANNLKKLASIHQIDIVIPESLDSTTLKQIAFDFIQKYNFGESPKHIRYNSIDDSYGQRINREWVRAFMANPMVKPLAQVVKPKDDLEIFHKWIKQFNLQKYVLVNIPSNKLTAYNADKIDLEMKVIVGTRKNQTPVMAAYADAIMLYPYWSPTANIVHNEIIPMVIKDSYYLARNNFEVLDKSGQLVDPYTLDWTSFNRNNFPYTIRQGTGCDNSLGLLKINLQNPFSIYLHDTPHTTQNKRLFDRENRFFSHGCIRLDKPLELANWLQPVQRIDEKLMEKCLLNQKPQVVSLIEKVPVFLMYFTEYLNENGELVQLNDVYNLND
jgi:murein L,D-transpeptidase YcbB/YkuD